MGDGRLEFEEELFVLGIVHRPLRIRPSESADCIERLPERDQQEVRPVALGSAEDDHALIAGCLPIFLQPGLLQNVEVRVGFG